MIQWRCLLTLLCLLVSIPAFSELPYRVRDVHLVKNADLIFEGQVTDVQYKNSDPNEEDESLPHTFVTFKVINVLKGKPQNTSSFTLRFMGGVKDASRVMEISSYPLFDVGDRDVLFVRKNTVSPCPLVGMNQGRIRIVNNLAYRDMGGEIYLGSDAYLASEFVDKDILDRAAFINTLKNHTRKIDSKIWDSLNEESRQLLQQYASMGISQLYVIRFLLPDFNRLLLNDDFFSASDLTEVTLRDETQALVQRSPGSLTPDEVIRKNRLILEDIFGSKVLLPSQSQTFLTGGTARIEEAMTHYYGPHKMEMIEGTVTDPYNNPRGDAPPVSGKRLTYTELMSHLSQLISLYHTSTELGALPVTPSANLNESFKVNPLTPQPPVDFSFTTEPPLDEEEQKVQNSLSEPKPVGEK